MDYKVSILFDFYAEMLTEKQREVIELYHNQDLSLAEITEHIGITRQGVRDSVKRGEATMIELEEKLGFAKWFSEIYEGLSELESAAQSLEEYNNEYTKSSEISARILQMKEKLLELKNFAD